LNARHQDERDKIGMNIEAFSPENTVFLGNTVQLYLDRPVEPDIKTASPGQRA